MSVCFSSPLVPNRGDCWNKMKCFNFFRSSKSWKILFVCWVSSFLCFSLEHLKKKVPHVCTAEVWVSSPFITEVNKHKTGAAVWALPAEMWTFPTWIFIFQNPWVWIFMFPWMLLRQIRHFYLEYWRNHSSVSAAAAGLVVFFLFEGLKMAEKGQKKRSRTRNIPRPTHASSIILSQ